MSSRMLIWKLILWAARLIWILFASPVTRLKRVQHVSVVYRRLSRAAARERPRRYNRALPPFRQQIIFNSPVTTLPDLHSSRLRAPAHCNVARKATRVIVSRQIVAGCQHNANIWLRESAFLQILQALWIADSANLYYRGSPDFEDFEFSALRFRKSLWYRRYQW